MAKNSPWSTFSSLFVKPDEEPVNINPPEEELSGEEPVAYSPPEPPPLVGSSEITEGRPFAEIYAGAGVPASAYPVEKLLKVIDGLSTMPPEQIRIMVAAMDAADESWTIEDPVNDALAKIEVLRGEKGRLIQVAAQTEAQGKSDNEGADTALAETAASIKAQIEAMQTQLHEEMKATSAKKAENDAKVRAAKEACAREGVRLDTEIGRLNRVPNTFAASLAGSANPGRK